MGSWALIMVSVAISLIVGVPLLGLYLYSPRRARQVKIVETSDAKVSARISYLRAHYRSLHHRLYRLDRGYHYIGLHVGVFCYAICLLAGAPVTSNVASLSESSRLTLSACFVLGAILVLIGAAMGMRFGDRVFRYTVRYNDVEPLLGEDIRLPYTFGAAGMFSMCISLGIYAWTSFQSTLGSLGGWLTLAFAAVSAAMLVLFVAKIRKYTADRRELEGRALAQCR